MANAISFYVGGKGNRKIKPRNMSMHLIRHLLREHRLDGGVPKLMNVESEFYIDGLTYTRVVREEIRVPLTHIQHDSLLDEIFRRRHA